MNLANKDNFAGAPSLPVPPADDGVGVGGSGDVEFSLAFERLLLLLQHLFRNWCRRGVVKRAMSGLASPPPTLSMFMTICRVRNVVILFIWDGVKASSRVVIFFVSKKVHNWQFNLGVWQDYLKYKITQFYDQYKNIKQIFNVALKPIFVNS